MRTTTPQHLSELQKNPKNIRNICILAHVDHGKTTIADALVASNGIISQRLAGKLRYMDSREDEQLRGITMKSSAISLLFSKENEEFIVNLIDSPGHVDFSSEVSTAVRLCDGAIVVVDVVEGVCPQTHVVLRQAWLENIRPCLVLNKIDRLITELKYSPTEAHFHLQQTLEKVNAVMAALFTSEVLEKNSSKAAPVNEKNKKILKDEGAVSIDEWSSGLEETDDSSLYFSPDLGNVLFSSAIDGWGFSIDDFARMYSSKLGINEVILKKTLWGDYYLHAKSKRILEGAQAKAKKPLFVQFVLENLWAVYDALLRRDKIKTDQIVKSLNLKISARDSRHTDGRVHLKALFDQWLPLSASLLSMIVDKLPSPMEIHSERVEKLMCSGLRTFDSLPDKTQSLKQDFLACSSADDVPVIVFVSKMFAVEDSVLPKHRKRPLTQEEIAARREQARQRHAEMLASNSRLENGTPLILEPAVREKNENENGEKQEKLTKDKDIPKNHVLAFARVYSGSIKKGQQLYVLGPKHDPRETPCKDMAPLDAQDPSLSNSSVKDGISEGLSAAKSVDRGTNQHVAAFTVQDLYLLMGRELESLESVPAGNVLGIGGLDTHVLKSATISSTVTCPPFTALPMEARPIVRVAVEPVHPADMPALARGLRLLNQADPCVETFVQETGEHVIVGAGEVHLQRCIDDLEQRFAGIKLNVSAPIVPFRETIVPPPTVDRVNEAIVSETSAVPAKQIDTEEGGEGNKTTLDKDKGLVEIKTANRMCTLHIRAIPLPAEVTRLLESKSDLIKVLVTVSSASTVTERRQLASEVNASTREALKTFYQDLCAAFKEAGNVWHGAAVNIWAFGPRRIGSNVLLNRVPGYNRPSIWQNVGIADNVNQSPADASNRDYDNSVVSGFQLASLAGPLCEEPLMGVCFVIEKWTLLEKEMTSLVASDTSWTGLTSSREDESGHEGKTNDENNLKDGEITEINEVAGGDQGETNELDEVTSLTTQELRNDNSTNTSSRDTNPPKKIDRFGPFSGQLMSAIKEGCRRAFLLQPVRLMAAMYTCDIQATAEVLGRMYAVVAKREGRVLKEEMKEGSDVFDVTAVLPVAESFGFSEDIRKRTSGLANPQLVFSHWEVVDIDPYWVPTTEEEYTHFGEKADSDNQARKYMNSVRRRKGLYVEEKTVEHAEKQRTLKK